MRPGGDGSEAPIASRRNNSPFAKQKTRLAAGFLLVRSLRSVMVLVLLRRRRVLRRTRLCHRVRRSHRMLLCHRMRTLDRSS